MQAMVDAAEGPGMPAEGEAPWRGPQPLRFLKIPRLVALFTDPKTIDAKFAS